MYLFLGIQSHFPKQYLTKSWRKAPWLRKYNWHFCIITVNYMIWEHNLYIITTNYFEKHPRTVKSTKNKKNV